MIYDLPTALTVNGKKREIDSDYRTAIDCILALQAPELTQSDKASVLLQNIYWEPIKSDEIADAIELAVWFLGGGEADNGKKRARLMDWEQDFRHIVTPINRVAGCEVRSLKYLHWWTFLGYYAEIGDCTFAQIVRIRSLKAKGKKLDKADAQWYRENRDTVDLKVRFTQAENDAFAAWGV